ncbi:hypothetical protein KSP39_PZI012251 [Platanthera zijinensis]|uniref:Methyltransferase n=1 Tax=Platanthera zijinensis TaxID=2320716 RepID=A0AAP0G547_9ASPA
MSCACVDSPPPPPPSLCRRIHSLAFPASISLSTRYFSFTRCRTSLLVVSSSTSFNSRDSSTKEEKNKLLLEKYGFDPNDFISQPTRRSRRRGAEKEEREKPQEVAPRSTHKLLQSMRFPYPPRLPFPLLFPWRCVLLSRTSLNRCGFLSRCSLLFAYSLWLLYPPRAPHLGRGIWLLVLGGKARRKKLLSPKGMDVRPMMEVVRGAAFDILQVAGGCPASLRPGRWLDLYSGTGSVGIEAISRGCSEAHFVEMDPWVVSEVLRPNLEWTGFLDNSVIHTVRVENFLDRTVVSSAKDGPFDYVSVTPPYTAVNYSILLEQLAKCPLVGENCFILVEYPLKTSMVESCGHLVKLRIRRSIPVRGTLRPMIPKGAAPK